MQDSKDQDVPHNTVQTEGETLHQQESIDSQDDTYLSSPPPILVEPEVPDPFVVDDGEESLSDSEQSRDEEDDRPEDASPTLAEEISLVQPALLDQATDTITPARSPAPPTPVSKTPVTPTPVWTPRPDHALPPPPVDVASEDEEDEPPELYLPGLVIPTMFLPIPNTDPLTTLLTKYIPPEKRPVRDLTGEWQRSDFHTLVAPVQMTNSWRALARMARDRIVASNPEDVSLILSLWYLRLSSLARLRLFNQTTAELTNLFTVLHSVNPTVVREYLFERVLPFELEVLHAKTRYWAGDHMAYLDELSGLLKRCRNMARRCGRRKDEGGSGMWKERGSRVGLILASHLIEMKDYTSAAHLITPLLSSASSSPYLRSALARIYLQTGQVSLASQHFSLVAADPTAGVELKQTNKALEAYANGEWKEAEEVLRELGKGILGEGKEGFVAVNNLAVALLSQGHLKEAIQVLEDALHTSPATVVSAEPFVFNLSTLYELRSSTAADKKRDLLIEVAKWAGDGLRTACLKMPTI